MYEKLCGYRQLLLKQSMRDRQGAVISIHSLPCCMRRVRGREQSCVLLPPFSIELRIDQKPVPDALRHMRYAVLNNCFHVSALFDDY